MFRYDWQESTVLALLLVSAINTSLISFFSYDMLTKFLPDYASWFFKGIGILSLVVIYLLYKEV